MQVDGNLEKRVHLRKCNATFFLTAIREKTYRSIDNQNPYVLTKLLLNAPTDSITQFFVTLLFRQTLRLGNTQCKFFFSFYADAIRKNSISTHNKKCFLIDELQKACLETISQLRNVNKCSQQHWMFCVDNKNKI